MIYEILMNTETNNVMIITHHDDKIQSIVIGDIAELIKTQGLITLEVTNHRGGTTMIFLERDDQVNVKISSKCIDASVYIKEI